MKVHISASVQATTGQTELTIRNKYVLCLFPAAGAQTSGADGAGGYRAPSEILWLCTRRTETFCTLMPTTRGHTWTQELSFEDVRLVYSQGLFSYTLIVLEYNIKGASRSVCCFAALLTCVAVVWLLSCCCALVAVCQCFAVLEDGALAHNLQEQESEYSHTHLVKNDLWWRAQTTLTAPSYYSSAIKTKAV